MPKAFALALVASLFVAPVANAQEAPYKPLFLDHPAIVQIKCGSALGTAFRVGSHSLVTAQHVAKQGPCTIDGMDAQVTYMDERLDFASIRVAWSGPFLKVDCGGFQAGKIYGGSGFAAGLPFNRVIVVRSEPRWAEVVGWDDFDTLEGPETFIPGQSGGPVLDPETEMVTGIVKGLHKYEPVSYARALKDTPLCSKQPSA